MIIALIFLAVFVVAIRKLNQNLKENLARIEENSKRDLDRIYKNHIDYIMKDDNITGSIISTNSNKYYQGSTLCIEYHFNILILVGLDGLITIFNNGKKYQFNATLKTYKFIFAHYMYYYYEDRIDINTFIHKIKDNIFYQNLNTYKYEISSLVIEIKKIYKEDNYKLN